NCNPETVSTDYDTSDRLYFEPLTLEDVLAICDEEKPIGVIVQFGGQTPLKLAVPLEQRGVKLLGTTADAIDRAEDRGRFDELLTKLALKRPRSGIAQSQAEAVAVADCKRCVIGGVMQHIEEAGVHSGDSSSVLPPHSLPREIVASIEEQSRM